MSRRDALRTHITFPQGNRALSKLGYNPGPPQFCSGFLELYETFPTEWFTVRVCLSSLISQDEESLLVKSLVSQFVGLVHKDQGFLLNGSLLRDSQGCLSHHHCGRVRRLVLPPVKVQMAEQQEDKFKAFYEGQVP